MRRYPTYKSSGVDWLGKIPSGWDCKNLKRITKFAYGDSLPDENRNGGEIPVYGSNGIVGFHDKALTKAPCIIIGRKGSYGRINYTDKACFPIDTSYFIDFTQTKSDLRWLMYFLTILRLNENTLDDTVPGLSREWAYRMPGLIVPLPEQKSIVQFLDYKTGQIGNFIANRQNQIELLKEQKDGIINKAVTKGIYPNAKMKPSGIEWIGEIPEGWRVSTISNLAKKLCNRFVGPTYDILVESGVKYLQSLHIKGNQIKFNTPYFISEKWSKEHPRSILKKGDVLIVQTGDIGQVACVTDEFEGCNCHALIIFQVKKKMGYGEYISTLLSSNFGNNELKSVQTGALLPHLNVGTIKYIKLPVPPKEEQLEILDYIKTETAIIDDLISKYQKQIDLMHEYRTSLISQAVTGKIDLRDWQPKKKVEA